MDKNKLHVVIGMAVASLGVICLGHVVSAVMIGVNRRKSHWQD